jgi:hypoxanthine phosphoribosyltransferase
VSQVSPIRELISADRIRQTVQSLGTRLSDEYRGRPLTILGVLSGSLMFVADLMRTIRVPHQLGLLQASSYRGTATTPGELRINTEFLPRLVGRDVLVIDDILDTGHTLAALLHQLRELGPASLRTAVLLWKRERTVTDIVPDYYGFEIPDEFVVGYGLDFNDDYRHLPYVGVLNSPNFAADSAC